INVSVTVRVPKDDSRKEWLFQGQVLSIPMKLSDNVATLKIYIGKNLNAMPVKKMKLKVVGGSFLKDGLSLAYYNITSHVPLEIGVKARGGRK
ncbi:hypothetical protein MHBO_004365, partial [Bonamia ostreae]